MVAAVFHDEVALRMVWHRRNITSGTLTIENTGKTPGFIFFRLRNS